MGSGFLGIPTVNEFALGIDDNNKQKGKNQQQNQQAYQTAAHPNSSTPNGSQSWTQDAKTGQWTSSQNFGGPLGGANASLANQAATAYAQPFDNGSAARDQAITSAYGQATSRLDPQWAERSQQQASSLANQGLGMDSEAYRNSMRDFGAQRNDAYTSAMNSAIGQGTAAQQATFAENMAARNAPLAALLQMNGLLPNAAGSQGLQALQSANLYTQGQQAYGQQQGADAVGAIGKLFTSDERVKQDIQRLPAEAAPGVPFSLFSYKAKPSQRYLGVIAQDLEKQQPEAVSEGSDGVKRVAPQFAPFALTPKKGR